MNITEFAMFKIMAGKGGGNAGGGGGEAYLTCKIKIYDQDFCGPYIVNYKAFENGSLVDKEATVPCGEDIVIYAVQGTEIFVGCDNSTFSTIAIEDVYDNRIGWYIMDASILGVITAVPALSECTIWICG